MSAASPTPQELTDYLADFYGRCAAQACACNRPGQWKGRGCPHWQPMGWQSFDEISVPVASA
jgi:hypothetical protein